MKICLKCKKEKKLCEFGIDNSIIDKLCIYCKKCKNEIGRIYYKNNSKKEAKRKHKQYENNKEKILKRQKVYNKNHKTEKAIYDKIYKKQNKKKIRKQNEIYQKNNKEQIAGQKQEYHNSKATYDTYASQISYADKVRNVDGFLQTKCSYCGKWYYPTTQEIQSRIKALNGQVGNAENRLYCSI
jgi:hypothetical protein